MGERNPSDGGFEFPGGFRGTVDGPDTIGESGTQFGRVGAFIVGAKARGRRSFEELRILLFTEGRSEAAQAEVEVEVYSGGEQLNDGQPAGVIVTELEDGFEEVKINSEDNAGTDETDSSAGGGGFAGIGSEGAELAVTFGGTEITRVPVQTLRDKGLIHDDPTTYHAVGDAAYARFRTVERRVGVLEDRFTELDMRVNNLEGSGGSDGSQALNRDEVERRVRAEERERAARFRNPSVFTLVEVVARFLSGDNRVVRSIFGE